MPQAELPFFVREKEHIKVLSLDTDKAEQNLESQEPLLSLPTPKASLWSPDGLLLALADPTLGVQVVDFAQASGGSGQEGVQTLPGSSKTTQSLQWSPNSKVLVTTSPAVKGSTEPNVLVYAINSNGQWDQAGFHYPRLEKDKKIFQWTPDSSICARLCPDGNLNIVPGHDVGGEVLQELAMAHAVGDFEFAPTQPSDSTWRLAIFVPDVRDDMQRVVGPAEVTIWDLKSSGEGEDMVVNHYRKAYASVSSGQISELKWNAHSSALLAHCQTEVDETGASYYGGSKLLLLSYDGSYQNELTEESEGAPSGTTVQAVSWSPTKDEFVYIRGFQPSQATLWSWDEETQKATLAKVLLEKAHRNTIRFNHFGSLVCLAGFGNLAGDVDFFGRRASEKCDYIRISSCQANCTVSAEWSPDGRHFLTAVLAPRMRVDNGIGVWKALEGTKVCTAMFEELTDAAWRPDPPGNSRFSDVSPDEVEQAAKDCDGAAGAAAPKKQAYRPPKARGETAGNVAAMMRGEMAPDPADDRRRKTRETLRPPQRRDEADHSPDASGREDGKKGNSKDAQDGAVAQPKAARPPADPPVAPVPSAPPPKNPVPRDTGGYAAAKAPMPNVPPQAQTAPAQRAKAPAEAPPKAPATRFPQENFGGETNVSHGQKLPCPNNGWQYVDPKQNIQGPFTLLEMQSWHKMGYFKPNLPMRCCTEDRFIPFQELFPHPMIPFQSYPKRPMQHGMNMRGMMPK